MTALRTLMLIALVAVFAAAESATDETNDQELAQVQRVLAVEKDWITAEVGRDEATLKRVIDDRFIINSSRGQPGSKATLIAAVMNMNMVAQTLSDQTVLVDGNTAIVMGTALITFAVEGGDDKLRPYRYITTYILRNDQWRALALQMNEIDAE